MRCSDSDAICVVLAPYSSTVDLIRLLGLLLRVNSNRLQEATRDPCCAWTSDAMTHKQAKRQLNS
uniref:Uncharacterized protein n=1 Tax=Anguilla anguilla TaxID=7936 RepID=A0A0E9TKT7_ANGAN